MLPKFWLCAGFVGRVFFFFLRSWRKPQSFLHMMGCNMEALIVSSEMWNLFVIYECVKMFRRTHCLQLQVWRPQDVRFLYFYMEVTPSPDIFLSTKLHDVMYRTTAVFTGTNVRTSIFQSYLQAVWLTVDNLEKCKWSLHKSLNQTPVSPSKAIGNVIFLCRERRLLI